MCRSSSCSVAFVVARRRGCPDIEFDRMIKEKRLSLDRNDRSRIELIVVFSWLFSVVVRVAEIERPNGRLPEDTFTRTPIQSTNT